MHAILIDAASFIPAGVLIGWLLFKDKRVSKTNAIRSNRPGSRGSKDNQIHKVPVIKHI